MHGARPRGVIHFHLHVGERGILKGDDLDDGGSYKFIIVIMDNVGNLFLVTANCIMQGHSNNQAFASLILRM